MRLPVILFAILNLVATHVFAQTPFHLDSSFHLNGINIVEQGMTPQFKKHNLRYGAMLDDGRIVTIGWAPSANILEIIRMQPNGLLDSTYGTNGIATLTGAAYRRFKVTGTGRIYMTNQYLVGTSSSAMIVGVLDETGQYDNSFGVNGTTTVTLNTWPTVSGIDATSDGKVLLTGTTIDSGLYRHTVVRLLADGQLDNSFSQDGKLISLFDTINQFVVNTNTITNEGVVIKGVANGKMLVGGLCKITLPAWKSFVAKYNDDGTVDNSFGNNGIVVLHRDSINVYIQNMHLDNSGRILAVCKWKPVWSIGPPVVRTTVFRITAAGLIDSTYGVNGHVEVDSFVTDISDYNWGSDIQYDDKILIGGNVDTGINGRYAVARLTANGSVETTFGNNGLFTLYRGMMDKCNGVIAQPDGRIIMIGGGKTDLSVDTTYAIAIRIVDTIVATAISSPSSNVPVEQDLVAYPTPSHTGMFTIRCASANGGNATVRVTDLAGKYIDSRVVKTHAGLNEFEYVLPTSVPDGVYIMTLQTTTSQWTTRLVK